MKMIKISMKQNFAHFIHFFIIIIFYYFIVVQLHLSAFSPHPSHFIPFCISKKIVRYMRDGRYIFVE